MTEPARRPHPQLSPARRNGISARLRQARTNAGLTQQALAQAAGMPTRQYQRLEAQAVNPTAASLYALADALRVPVHELLP